MATKFIVLFALIALVSANPVYLDDSPPKYDYSYSVHDSETGDIKQQREVRDGDRVVGSYSLLDADGLHRIVDYTADDINGFQATVRREPITTPLEPFAAITPVAKYVSHSAPLTTVYTHPAPVNRFTVAPSSIYRTAPLTKIVTTPVSHYSDVAPIAHYTTSPVYTVPAASAVAHYTTSPLYSSPALRYVAPVLANQLQTPAHTYRL